MLVHWGVDALPSICSFACWQVCFVHSVVHFIALRWSIITKIWHKTFQSPVILPNGKRKDKKTATTHAKISKIHPRKTLMHWRKSGREAQAPLGTQPEGVSYLSGTCSVSLYSGPLPQERRQSLTDQQSHCLFPLYGGTWNQQQGEKTKCSASFSSEGLGAGVGILTAEHRETWSSQQDVINVTSSVGTRGSSTVHSDSSGEEK